MSRRVEEGLLQVIGVTRIGNVMHPSQVCGPPEVLDPASQDATIAVPSAWVALNQVYIYPRGRTEAV